MIITVINIIEIMKGGRAEQKKLIYKYEGGKTISSFYDKSSLRSTINDDKISIAKNPLVTTIKSELSNLKTEMNRLIQRESVEYPKENYKTKQYHDYRRSSVTIIPNATEYKLTRPPLQWNKQYSQDPISSPQIDDPKDTTNYLKLSMIDKTTHPKTYPTDHYLLPNHPYYTDQNYQTANQDKNYQQDRNRDREEDSKRYQIHQQNYLKQIVNLRKEIQYKQCQLKEKSEQYLQLQKQIASHYSKTDHKTDHKVDHKTDPEIQKLKNINSNWDKECKKLNELIKFKDTVIQKLTSEIKGYQIQISLIKENNQKRKYSQNYYINTTENSKKTQQLQNELKKYNLELSEVNKTKEEMMKNSIKDKNYIQHLIKAKEYAQKQINIHKQVLNKQINKLKQQIKQTEKNYQAQIHLLQATKQSLQKQLRDNKLKVTQQLQKSKQQIYKNNLESKTQINQIQKSKYLLEKQNSFQKQLINQLNQKNNKLLVQINDKKEQLLKEGKIKQKLQNQLYQIRLEVLTPIEFPKKNPSDDKSSQQSGNPQNYNNQLRNCKSQLKEKQQIIKNLQTQIERLRYQIHINQNVKNILSIFSQLTDQLNDKIVKKQISQLNKKYGI